MSENLSGLVVLLDDVGIDDLVGAAEVLVQEGFRTFSLPPASEAFAEFVAIYGARARVGVHGLASAQGVEEAAGRGASFAFLDHVDADALAAVRAAGLEVYCQAMTPTEVRAVLELPVAGAMLYPADVVGHQMGFRLHAVGLVDRVVPRGGMGAYAAGEWLSAGAPAVCIDTILLSDALHGGDLEALRDRCSSFATVQRKYS